MSDRPLDIYGRTMLHKVASLLINLIHSSMLNRKDHVSFYRLELGNKGTVL